VLVSELVGELESLNRCEKLIVDAGIVRGKRGKGTSAVKSRYQVTAVKM
jgi:hypothetical protein